MKLFRLTWSIPVILIMLIAFVVNAQAPNPHRLIVMGEGYNQVQDPFFISLANRADQLDLSTIQVLVLPVGIGSNPNTITDAERTAQLSGAEQQRQEIEATCKAFITEPTDCSAILVPVLTRTEAMSAPALAEFSPTPDGIVFLQNDARSILEIIQGTALEQEIISAYKAGAVISASGNLFSNHFIYGFRPKFNSTRTMTFGALLIGDSAGESGLGIFPHQAVLDTGPFSENRLSRLLNAITGPKDPHLGIGLETNAGFEFNESSPSIANFGESVIAILDAETYQAANALTYQPGTNLIGIRNVLVHLIASGSSTYDLNQRQSSNTSVEERISRGFDQLHLPPGSGTIMLTSNLLKDGANMEYLVEFTNLSGGQNAHLLIVTIGYADLQEAQSEAAQIAAKLSVDSSTQFIQPDSDEPLQIDSNITGVILTGQDAALVNPELLQALQSSWSAGLPILADRVGASILGLQFPSALQPDEQWPLLSPNRYRLRPGLGIIQTNIDPHALENSSWERMINTAYQFPANPVIGIASGAILEFDPDAVDILGTNVVSLLDFRTAALSTNEAGIISLANGLLDFYTPGEHIRTIVADMNAAPIHAPTPDVEAAIEATNPASNPTATATITAEEIQIEPTEAPRGKPPTRTPRPTGTPVPTPPPSDPGTTNLMVFFGVLSVVVVIVGVWLNRQTVVE